jgi:hypothetical protein
MARWSTCNILQSGSETRELWGFSAAGEGFRLNHHELKLPNEPLPASQIGKDWQTLYRKKLNVAWLPSDMVFLRAVQLPATDAAEALSMLDLQLEKLSPIPVQQAVWSFDLLPGKTGSLRTAILVIVERSYVEQFLGKLEEQSYQADRLEIPFVDQLLATKVSGHGAWVYPGMGPDREACLVAWWYDGILRNLSLLRVPPEPEAGRYLRQQLAQMAWAGECEGWITAPPRWHLVASPELATVWEPRLREEGDPVTLLTALPTAEAAALSAKRAASPLPRGALLPPEYAARYRQQFIDRIWMRGVGALLTVLVIGTLAYLAALQVLRLQVNRVEKLYLAQGVAYTNAIKIKAEVQVLQDQVDLQYAALECWKAAATLLPTELTLGGVNFQRGKTVTIFGTGPAGASQAASDYSEALSKHMFNDDRFFSKVGMPPDIHAVPGGLSWNLSAQLKRNVTE